MNVTEDLIFEIPLELISRFSGLITILKTLGWIVIIYIVFSIINTIINRKKKDELRQMNKTLTDIKKLLSKK